MKRAKPGIRVLVEPFLNRTKRTSCRGTLATEWRPPGRSCLTHSERKGRDVASLASPFPYLHFRLKVVAHRQEGNKW
ncbi:unnamed protein product [Victoria cruziana]